MLKTKVIQCLLSAAVATAVAMPATGYAQAGAATMNTPAASALSKGDQKIVADMARANMAEIEAAKLALANSQNAQVKTFAQQMIDDHTKALGDVTQLAQTKGVTLPTEPDSKHKAMAAKLGKMSGDAFDKAYMKQAGVADHKAVHALLKKHEANARDPDLKALAAKMLPTVEQHLHAASGKGGAAHGEQHGKPLTDPKAPASGLKPPVVGGANEQNAGGKR